MEAHPPSAPLASTPYTHLPVGPPVTRCPHALHVPIHASVACPFPPHAAWATPFTGLPRCPPAPMPRCPDAPMPPMPPCPHAPMHPRLDAPTPPMPPRSMPPHAPVHPSVAPLQPVQSSHTPQTACRCQPDSQWEWIRCDGGFFNCPMSTGAWQAVYQ